MRKIKVFITSGNTWVRIDPVRVVTNVFTGETGLSIANFLQEKSMDIILATSNPYLIELKGKTGIDYRHYKHFEELEEIIDEVVLNEQPDIIIHAAAISDYKPQDTSPTKIKSNQNTLDMGKWVPTKKLIKKIKDELDFQGLLIQFKLETVNNDKELIQLARESLLKNQSDICMANRFDYLEQVIAVDKENETAFPRSELNQHILELIKNKCKN